MFASILLDIRLCYTSGFQYASPLCSLSSLHDKRLSNENVLRPVAPATGNNRNASMPLLIRLLLPAGLAMQHRRPFIPKSLRTPKQELPAQSQHNNRLLDSMSSRTQRYHKIKGNGSVPWGESSLLGSCAGVYCSLGTRCAVVDGTPKCVCSTSCPLRDGPKTCGSDDVLYANECYMKALACRLGRRHLSVVRYGRCRERVQSREFECRRFFVVMETATFFFFLRAVRSIEVRRRLRGKS